MIYREKKVTRWSLKAQLLQSESESYASLQKAKDLSEVYTAKKKLKKKGEGRDGTGEEGLHYSFKGGRAERSR